VVEIKKATVRVGLGGWVTQRQVVDLIMGGGRGKLETRKGRGEPAGDWLTVKTSGL